MRTSSRTIGGPDGPLANLSPFTTHGSLHAVAGEHFATGRLPQEWARKYLADAASPGVRYTVVSYATPIAWVTTDGAVVIPDESYSVTTSRHQGMVRAWLGAARCVLCRRVSHPVAEPCWP